MFLRQEATLVNLDAVRSIYIGKQIDDKCSIYFYYNTQDVDYDTFSFKSRAAAEYFITEYIAEEDLSDEGNNS